MLALIFISLKDLFVAIFEGLIYAFVAAIKEATAQVPVTFAAAMRV